MKKDSPIQSADDLKRKKIGVYSLNSTGITLVRIALWKKYGHNVSFQGGDSEWVQVPAPTIPAALASDQIDAGTLENRAEFIRIRKEPLVSGKEPKDIAPVVAKTLIGPRASDDHFQRLVDSMTMLHKESYIKTIEASTLYDRSASLSDIAVPTLLVFGGADTLAVPAVGERMAAEIPDSRLIVMPEAGHLVNIEFPEVFNESVLDFLDEHCDSVSCSPSRSI